MKKYQQLLLAIISIISFSCVLIYRHQYNQLRYVLEVLNFFGTPGGSTTAPLCRGNTTFINYQTSPIAPLPSWQRISNSLFIYSAYWEEINEKEHVKALAVGVLNENLNYGCYLWYDSYPKRKMGQFSFSGMPVKASMNKNSGKSRTKAFVFYCESDVKGITPVGVTFYKIRVNESTQGFIPVVSLQPNLPPQNSTGICILPSSFDNLNKSIVLEFLSFHQIIGVNDFIVYGSTDQHNLLASIQRNSRSKINLTIMQWNYPFFGDYDVMKVIAENDCKTRAIGVFENVLILEWNKFFVPRYFFTVDKILNNIDLQKKTFKFQFTTLLFCIEYEDDIKSNITTPLVFRKTKYAFPKIDMLVPVYRPYMRSGKVQKVGKDIAAVHQYASCRDFKIKSGEKKVAQIDTSMYRFQNQMLQSRLLEFEYQNLKNFLFN